MATNWTEAQTRAIEEEGNIIVSAGAGSGKTAVLSERVLYYIKEKGYHLNEFLIVTFTNLAAKEMKNRIRKKLKENNLPDAEIVDSCDISTFDSFSNSLVKKYHTYLDVSSSFTIVDETIIKILMRRKIKEEFDKLYLAHDPIFEEMVGKYCYKSDEDLRNLVLTILSEKDKALDDKEFFDSFIDKYYSSNNINEINNVLLKMLKEQLVLLEDAVRSLPNEQINAKGKYYATPVYDYMDELNKLSGYDNIIKFVKNNKINYERKPGTGAYKFDEDTSKEVDKFKKIINGCLEKIGSYPSSLDISTSIEETKKYGELLLHIAKTVDEYQMNFKKEKNAYAFSDIFKMAIKLVRDFDEVREEVKNKYKMIMIDEYQDNSDFQETFINLIANNNVYCVGDIKQSIYAFRNAKPENFKNKYERYKLNQGGKAIDLVDNFRSREEVIAAFNDIFKDLMTNEIGDASYRLEHMVNAGNKSYIKLDNQDNNIETYLYDNSLKSDESLDREARIIAQDIIHKINTKYQVMDLENKKMRDCVFSDFAIIMDRGSSFEEYIRIFQEYKLPIYMEKDEDIKDNTVVKLLTNLLIVTNNMLNNNFNIEGDKTYKYAFLSLGRSFLYSYNDAYLYSLTKNNTYSSSSLYQDLYNVIKENKDATSYDLLLKILEVTDFYYKFVNIGDYITNEGYVDAFLNTFKNMQNLGFGYDEFIDYLKNIDDAGLKLTLTARGTSMNSIKLINIHKSKGLEYNIIYFPGLDKKFNRSEAKSRFGFSSKYGLIFTPFGEKIDSPIKIVHNYVSNKSDLSEKVRLFYVALTRVREKMILVCKEPKEEDYEANFKDAKSFYNFYSPFIERYKKTYFDEVGEEQLNEKTQEYEPFTYDFREVNIESSIKSKVLRASKETSLDVNKDVLKFGNHLHEGLEVTDFVNPDYSLLKDKFVENKVRAFLSSPLTKNIKEAKIYKEYEFIDETNNTNGIIDLLLVYEDHIDIIDYKTKHIDDEGYNKQLHVYYDFVSQKYPNKEIHMYLYSILTSEIKEIL